jgi:signal transduction histidine kinase
MEPAGGQQQAARSADGRLWFPNQYTVAVFDPASIPSSDTVRPVIFEETVVDGVPLAGDPAKGLRVKSNARSLEFHFTSPTFLPPERLQFRYRLKGQDEQWINAGKRRVAYYNNLTPGPYEFQAMVGGPNGIWRETGHSLRLDIVPQWWQRTSVRWLGGLLLLGALAAGVRMAERARLRRRMQELQNQQALEQERRRIAQDLHDDIGARLTQLSLQGDLVCRENRPANEMRHEVAGMTGRVRELVVAMDEIVWAINPRHDSMASLARYIQHYAAEFFEPLPIRCRVAIQAALPEAILNARVRHNIFLVVKEALHNAAKHSGAAEVRLAIRREGPNAIITVDDDGRGFAPAPDGGIRHGLTNMRSRLQDIGGDCHLESQPGAGCRVSFTIPCFTHLMDGQPDGNSAPLQRGSDPRSMKAKSN